MTLAQRMELLNNKATNISMQKQQSTGKIATTNTALATNHVVAFQESKVKSNKSISPLFGNGNHNLCRVNLLTIPCCSHITNEALLT